MLSKKYYKAIAEIIRDTNTREELIRELETFFKNDNERFDIVKFRDAIQE